MPASSRRGTCRGRSNQEENAPSNAKCIVVQRVYRNGY
jgi:hypothetical protein